MQTLDLLRSTRCFLCGKSEQPNKFFGPNKQQSGRIGDDDESHDAKKTHPRGTIINSDLSTNL